MGSWLLRPIPKDTPLDSIRDPLVLRRGQIRRAHGRPDREVAAGDVVADPRRRDVLAVSDNAADRHRVAEVTVRAQHRRRALLSVGAAPQLVDRCGVVLSENLHISW
jgi:hypothetical protein